MNTSTKMPANSQYNQVAVASDVPVVEEESKEEEVEAET